MSNRVPISRLPNQQIRRRSGRISRACDECRARKAKCDGAKPTCLHCDRAGISCKYSETKRKREITELERSKQRADLYEKFLREIIHEVDLPVASKINKVLQSSGSNSNSTSTSASSSRHSSGSTQKTSYSSIPSSPSSVGSGDENGNGGSSMQSLPPKRICRENSRFCQSPEDDRLRGLQMEADVPHNEKELRNRMGPFSPPLISPASSMNSKVDSAMLEDNHQSRKHSDRPDLRTGSVLPVNKLVEEPEVEEK